MTNPAEHSLATFIAENGAGGTVLGAMHFADKEDRFCNLTVVTAGPSLMNMALQLALLRPHTSIECWFSHKSGSCSCASGRLVAL